MRGTVAVITLVLAGCERTIQRDGVEACPDGYMHTLGELCVGSPIGWLIVAAVTLALIAMPFRFYFRAMRFMDTAETRLAAIEKAARDKSAP